MNGRRKEWSRYYNGYETRDFEILHARFVEHRYPRHTHDYFVVALVESGTVSYWYRGAQWVASPGHVFLVNPGEPHTGEPTTAAGYVYRVLYPRAEYLARIAADIGRDMKAPFFQEAVLQDPLLYGLLSRFHRRFAEDAPKVESESLLLRALERLIARHAAPHVAPKTVGTEKLAIRKAREYIAANFAQDVSLSTLAGLSSLSPSYFARSFEFEVGIPPHAYLEGIRIQKGRELLDRGETIVSAALSIGYSDQSHFTHRFKRFLGITPGQYAREDKCGAHRSSEN